MRKPWGRFLGPGDAEFGERVLGSVAVGLCWIPFDTPAATIRVGFSFPSGCCAVFPGMRACTETECVCQVLVIKRQVQNTGSLLSRNMHISRGAGLNQTPTKVSFIHSFIHCFLAPAMCQALLRFLGFRFISKTHAIIPACGGFLMCLPI